MRVKDHHLAHLREHGYVIVPNFLTKAELKAALADTQNWPARRENTRRLRTNRIFSSLSSLSSATP